MEVSDVNCGSGYANIHQENVCDDSSVGQVPPVCDLISPTSSQEDYRSELGPMDSVDQTRSNCQVDVTSSEEQPKMSHEGNTTPLCYLETIKSGPFECPDATSSDGQNSTIVKKRESGTEDLSSGRFSDVPGDYATFQCSICQFSGFYQTLREHTYKSHNLKYKEFQEIYGTPQFKDKVFYKCKECDATIVYISAYVGAHLKSHSMTRLEYEKKHSNLADSEEKMGRFSDVPGDYTVYKCHKCNYTGDYKLLQIHIKKQHKLNITQYKQECGDLMIIDRVNHKCKVCGKVIYYQMDSLHHHLKFHFLTIAQYKEKYLVAEVGSGSLVRSLKRERSFDLEDQDPSKLKKPNSVHETDEVSVQGQTNLDNVSELSLSLVQEHIKTKGVFNECSDRDIKDEHTFDRDNSSFVEKPVRFSDIPGDYTTYKCHVCNYTGSYTYLISHVVRHHKLTLTQYMETHGELKINERINHKCKLCDKVVQYEKKLMQYHLMQCHNLTFDQYYSSEPAVKHISRVEAEERFSDVFGDYSTYKCEECTYSGKYTSLRSHIVRQHKLTLTEYKQKWGELKIIDRVNHKCKICSMVVFYQLDNLRFHLKCHFLTIDQYKEKYLEAPTKSKKVRSAKVLKCTKGAKFGTNYLNVDNIKVEPNFENEGDDVSVQGQSNFETIHEFASNFVEAVYEHDSDDIARIKVEPNCENESDDIPVQGQSNHENVSEFDSNFVREHIKTEEEFDQYFDSDSIKDLTFEDRNENTSFVEKPERFSDEPGDYTSYKCHKCNFSGSYTNFRTHIVRHHRLTITQYREEHGDMMVNELVHHKCKICDKLIKYERKPLESHLMQYHSLTVDQYYDPEPVEKVERFSDIPGDYTTYKCQRCNYTGKYKLLQKHIRVKYKLSIAQYKQEHGELMIIDRVNHKCKICSKIVLYQSDNLRSHLKYHLLTIEEYQEKYSLEANGTNYAASNVENNRTDQEKNSLQANEATLEANEASEDSFVTSLGFEDPTTFKKTNNTDSDSPMDNSFTDSSEDIGPRSTLAQLKECSGKNLYDETVYTCSYCNFNGHSLEEIDGHHMLEHKIKVSRMKNMSEVEAIQDENIQFQEHRDRHIRQPDHNLSVVDLKEKQLRWKKVNPERAPELLDPEKSPELLTPEQAPELLTPEQAPDLRSPEQAPKLLTPEQSPDFLTPEKAPDLLAP